MFQLCSSLQESADLYLKTNQGLRLQPREFRFSYGYPHPGQLQSMWVLQRRACLSLLVIRHFVPWIPGGVRSLNTGLNHTGGSQWLRPPVSLRTASCSFHSPSIPRVKAHHRAPETILALSNCRPLFSRGGITLTLNYLFHFLALDIEKLRHLQTKPWFD